MKKLFATLVAVAALAIAPVTVNAAGSVSANSSPTTGEKDYSVRVANDAASVAFAAEQAAKLGLSYDSVATFEVKGTPGVEQTIFVEDLGTLIMLVHNDGGRLEVVSNARQVGKNVKFTSNTFSPFTVVYKKADEASSPASAKQPEIANKSLVAGMTWADANGSYTSLGDGRYYNQFNTVFNGEGTIVGKYNPATGVVSALAANTTNSTVANGTYTVPNTAAK